jgi:hypothetical protein
MGYNSISPSIKYMLLAAVAKFWIFLQKDVPSHFGIPDTSTPVGPPPNDNGQ